MLQTQREEALFQTVRVGHLVAFKPADNSRRIGHRGGKLPHEEREDQAMNEILQSILHLYGELKEIKAHLQYLKKTRAEIFNESWIDGQDVLLALNISQRTLQTLRDSGTLPFSKLNGKFYYKVSDLEALLESNYSGNLKRQSHD